MAWDQTKTKIITRSLRILGVISQGDTLSAEQLAEGSDALNSLFQSLSEEDIYLFKTKWIALPLSATSEVIGSDSLNYTCRMSHVSAAENKPITGDYYNAYWQQSGSAGTPWADNTVYNFIGDLLLPAETLHVLKVFTRRDNQDYPCQLITRDEYASIVDKYGSKSNWPSRCWHDRYNNSLHFWPIATAVGDYIVHIQAQVVMEDLLLSGGTPDAPRSYYDLICYALAANLADEYVIPLQERGFLMQKSEDLKRKARRNNTEDTTNFIKTGAF